MSHRQYLITCPVAWILIGALCLMVGLVQAADISVAGNWSRTIDEQDLVGGAGTGFRSPIESEPGQATLNIQNIGGEPWRVKVRHTLTNLPDGVTLAVKRSSDGTGQGVITGGTDYLVLSDTEQTLCEGTGERTGIGLRFSLQGVTIFQVPGLHQGTLIYRVE
jgi:hypothetical protein